MQNAFDDVLFDGDADLHHVCCHDSYPLLLQAKNRVNSHKQARVKHRGASACATQGCAIGNSDSDVSVVVAPCWTTGEIAVPSVYIITYAASWCDIRYDQLVPGASAVPPKQGRRSKAKKSGLSLTGS